ncbi:GNAT family N-acetyltransferase [Bowmanella dokdonensis]|uniref:N-acetyltransferase n=1 Tax=Bowmanella dokdonensis TaxID=751969 RepID=A0A939DQP8_9ALTE|nr:GNAT family N-acetyltransferase [Bowmanella dokdonensis]MBN7827062.1 N-acetyltransferase [Bowmanella dokdonensis]
MKPSLQFVDSAIHIDPNAWTDLARHAGPFLQPGFLLSLEESASVGPGTGWRPRHLLVKDQQKLIGLMPLYVKSHSYGEYVFDFAWAEAYTRHGLTYYPKLVAAVPFTPVPGPRLLLSQDYQESLIWPEVQLALKHLSRQQGYSSLHILFDDKQASKYLLADGWMQRQSVQFHWFNHNYQSFDDFTATFSSRKRKNLKKERSRLQREGIECRRLTGADISAEDIATFYHCYQHTYLKRSGHNGYLNQAFFQSLREQLSDQLLLVQAFRRGRFIASALMLFDQHHLYGRYWGGLEEIDCLHFEVCYYQGIEFCIEQSLHCFNPGTQGEHKIQRGFEPTDCYSLHWLAHADFHQAVGHFLQQEKLHLAQYKRAAQSLLPFRSA